MPSSLANGLPFVLCPDNLPAAFAAQFEDDTHHDHAGHHGDTGTAAIDHCDFGQMVSSIATHEKQILRGALGVLALAFLLYVISISTPFWVKVTIPGGYERTFEDGSRRTIVEHHAGLWRICRVEQRNDTRGE